jgi:hypothetical protein
LKDGPRTSLTADMSRYKRIRRIAVLLVAGFLAFAPPGTMIVSLLLVWALIGRTWFIVACVCCVSLAAAALILRRRRATHGTKP